MSTNLVLNTTAVEINRLHHAAQRSAGEALQLAKQAGDLLLEVKEKLGHGEFLPWLAEHCEVGERQAQRYMRLSKNWEAISANTTSTSDLGALGIAGALEHVATPRDTSRQATFRSRFNDELLMLAERTASRMSQVAPLSECKTRDDVIARGRALADNIRDHDELFHRYGVCAGVGYCSVCDSTRITESVESLRSAYEAATPGAREWFVREYAAEFAESFEAERDQALEELSGVGRV